MTQEEILQYNQRCAEFLGEEMTTYFVETQMDLIGSSELHFHSDWNWIMEVVEAIEKLGYYTNILSAENNSMKHTMHINKVHEEEKYTLFVDSKKEAVVQAINQFLIWYEQNKTV